MNNKTRTKIKKFVDERKPFKIAPRHEQEKIEVFYTFIHFM
jgi:hypothetical protein